MKRRDFTKFLSTIPFIPYFKLESEERRPEHEGMEAMYRFLMAKAEYNILIYEDHQFGLYEEQEFILEALPQDIRRRINAQVQKVAEICGGIQRGRYNFETLTEDQLSTLGWVRVPGPPSGCCPRFADFGPCFHPQYAYEVAPLSWFLERVKRG